MTVAAALKDIEKRKGKQFDPEMVEAFLDLSKTDEFKDILQDMRKNKRRIISVS